jgi:hypothetical protein
MYIAFDSSTESIPDSSGRFAVKVYVGGVNAVSGEPAQEPMAIQLRRANFKAKGISVQDYIVVGHQTPFSGQKWLDGVAVEPGKVRQFLATPVGSGCSVESQVTGSEFNGGIQFEVTPKKTRRRRWVDSVHLAGGNASIYVKDLNGRTMTVTCDVFNNTDIDLVTAIDRATGIPKFEIRLVFMGKQLGQYVSYGTCIRCLAMKSCPNDQP